MGKKRELVARHKSGKEFPIELGLTEILHRGGKVTFTGVVRDLSDQKHDKVELRLKHSLTLSIIEAAFDAMFYINERGIIQMVNEAAVKQFGWSRSEFLGSNISMICGGGEFTLWQICLMWLLVTNKLHHHSFCFPWPFLIFTNVLMDSSFL